jgi:alkanesulfonate monooxygenase
MRVPQMKIELPDRKIYIFSVIYREECVQEYKHNNVRRFIKESEACGYSGMLLFESSNGDIEPWVLGQEVLAQTESLTAFIAVNPAYMHPFLAAKKILTLTHFYHRRIFLNFITGTSKSDLTNLNDHLTHDEKYERLIEFVEIVHHLLTSPVPLNFSGKYYSVYNLKLSSVIPESLIPRYFIAGSSEGAIKAKGRLNADAATMAKNIDTLQRSNLEQVKGTAVHFGVLARTGQMEANEVLNQWLGVTDLSRQLFKYSLRNTDSQWKRELSEPLVNDEPKSVYSLTPLHSFKSDCPYYVGSYEQIAEVVVKLIVNGFDTLIVELPDLPEENEHVSCAFNLAQQILLSDFYTGFKDQAFSFNLND